MLLNEIALLRDALPPRILSKAAERHVLRLNAKKLLMSDFWDSPSDRRIDLARSPRMIAASPSIVIGGRPSASYTLIQSHWSLRTHLLNRPFSSERLSARLGSIKSCSSDNP